MTFENNLLEMTTQEFAAFQRLVDGLLGIKLSDTKKTLIVSRLSSRLRHLELQTFTEYLKYLSDSKNAGEELSIFINKVTTNETSFFREEKHFDYLKNELLPAFERKGKNRQLRIWSSACSSGEEPYSIAMTILDYFQDIKGMDIKILASDVNSDVLQKAFAGVYRADDVHKKVGDVRFRKYFKSVDEGLVKISDEVKKLVSFKRINLLSHKYPIKSALDVIFCRNVMIYFKDQMKEHIMRNFYDLLASDGTMFIGHSENLFSFSSMYKLEQNTIYKRVES